MALTASPYLALLDEDDTSLKVYALKSLDTVVDELWAEIANYLGDIEELYEDEDFEGRYIAALIASKVYYNLGDYESSVRFSLASGDQFDINENSEFVETIVSKCIEKYIADNRDGNHIDSKLTNIFERMLLKCCQENNYSLAVGVSLESYRLDLVEKIISEQINNGNEEAASKLIQYAMSCLSMNCLSGSKSQSNFKEIALEKLIELSFKLSKKPDYFLISKLIVQIDKAQLAVQLLQKLMANEKDSLIAYQIVFDWVQVASQELVSETRNQLTKLNGNNTDNVVYKKVTRILSGIPTCDYNVTFLANNNKTDARIVSLFKSNMDNRNSMFHNAVSFLNAFMRAGTTDDSFLTGNSDWLAKSSNWSKFSATAALGVIHKGNLLEGKTAMSKYLPERGGSHYFKGGSLYGLGFVYSGHGLEVVDYLRKHIVDKVPSAGTDEVDVVLHGACLGLGVASIGDSTEAAKSYDDLKSVLFSDSAVPAESAALAIGLILLGKGDSEVYETLFTYAKDTEHENIVRGIGLAIALMYFGREGGAQSVINDLLNDQNANLRYGGCFTVALAYCGTGDKVAIKKLLHYAVSDSSNDVRRAAVISLGFVLIKDYKTLPSIVELLGESYNPHVRYGTALALGVACAGKGNFQPAFDLLDTLIKDPVDFVRQGALIAKSLILIQSNEKSYPGLQEFKMSLTSIVEAKGQEKLTKFGAAVAHGILEAGGGNVTISLENPHTGSLNNRAIAGLMLFLQHWYWFPLSYFLSLSFTPTAIIGVTDDFSIPKFQLECHGKKSTFDYPPKLEDVKEKKAEKVETAVLSTTVRAKQRAKKKKDEEDEDEEMEVDDVKKVDSKSSSKTEVAEEEEPDLYEIDNLTRVISSQLKHVLFKKDSRFKPVRDYKNFSGILVLEDTKASEKKEVIKTLRQLKDTEAPVPEPFTVEFDELEL